jgi:hypothetical protein
MLPPNHIFTIPRIIHMVNICPCTGAVRRKSVDKGVPDGESIFRRLESNEAPSL